MAYDYLFKFVLLGDCAVGKSCLLKRFTEGTYDREFESTIGVEFGAKIIKVNEKNIKLQIWDTAGQETFKAITKSYYRGSSVMILMYDITRGETFISLEKWLKDIKSTLPHLPLIMIVGNKIDLDFKRQVEIEEAKEYASKNNFLFEEISVKSGMNANDIFYKLSKEILNKLEKGQVKASVETGIKIGQEYQIQPPDNNRCCYL